LPALCESCPNLTPPNLFVRTKFMCVNVKQQRFLRKEKAPLFSCAYPGLSPALPFSCARNMVYMNAKQQHILRRKKPPLFSCTYTDLTATLSPERDMDKIIRDKPSKRFNHS
ncbi:hypothetical protein ABLB44_23585, partial [Vibrio parahaemolyticus]